jgi:hypothetical protein
MAEALKVFSQMEGRVSCVVCALAGEEQDVTSCGDAARKTNPSRAR